MLLMAVVLVTFRRMTQNVLCSMVSRRWPFIKFSDLPPTPVGPPLTPVTRLKATLIIPGLAPLFGIILISGTNRVGP